jgi:hypothetical protein
MEFSAVKGILICYYGSNCTLREAADLAPGVIALRIQLRTAENDTYPKRK